MIQIDGNTGEGGGQILRSALGLSMVTGRPFTMKNIRAKRQKPGLLRQHLTAVNAAAQISQAEVTGNETGSKDLVFSPGKVQAGDYYFAIGTAGSATLVLQAILPALIMQKETSSMIVEGGTHNPFAPPAHFLEESFLPVLEAMGYRVRMFLMGYGFHPAGGGKIRLVVEPAGDLMETGILHKEVQSVTASCLVSNLPAVIARSESDILKKELKLSDQDVKIGEVRSPGPGNIVMVRVKTQTHTTVFTGFGEKNKRAADLVTELAQSVNEYTKSKAAVCSHLADQLLIPMALGKGGRFTTVKPTLHTLTNIGIIREFIPCRIEVNETGDNCYEIRVEPQKDNSSGKSKNPNQTG